MKKDLIKYRIYSDSKTIDIDNFQVLSLLLTSIYSDKQYNLYTNPRDNVLIEIILKDEDRIEEIEKSIALTFIREEKSRDFFNRIFSTFKDYLNSKTIQIDKKELYSDIKELDKYVLKLKIGRNNA